MASDLKRHIATRQQRSYTFHLLLIMYIESSISLSISSSSTEYDCRDLRDDVASKAVISPIIFEGRARRIETWGTNPQNQKPFNVTFKPRTVYKGDLPKIEGSKDYAQILVGQFGPAEDLNACIPSVQIGSRYIVFLKSKHDQMPESEDGMPYYDISQFPELTSKKASRHVNAYGCENCSFPPRIEPFIEVKVHLLTSQRLLLHCVTSGKPIPVVTWYRNGNPLITTNSKRINIKNKRDGSSLDIEKVVSQDSGLYRCNAKNILGEVLSDPVDVNITPSELEFCSSQGYCLNGGHCYVVPKTGRKICECQKNFTGVRCQEPNLIDHFLIMKQTYEFFERRLEGLVMTSILLIIILILLFFISVVCISRRKRDCKTHGCKQISNAVHQSSASAWNDSSVQTDRHYENVHMNQPLSPRTHDVTTAISPENSTRLSWMEKPHNHNMVVSSEACVIVGNQPPKPISIMTSVVPNKPPVESKKNKCEECKTEDSSKRNSSVFIETKDQLEMKTFRNMNQNENVTTRYEDNKDMKSKNVGCKLVNRDSGIDVRASRVTTSETNQANELLDLRLSEEVVGCCEIDGLNGKDDIHIYSNTPLETTIPAPRPTVGEILEQLRNNNDLQLVTPNKLSSIFQACKDKEKLQTKSAKDVSCGCPDNSLANARTQDEKHKPTANLAPSEKNNKRLSCNVEVQTDKRCKELLSQNKSELQKRKSCYVISSAINGVVFTEVEKAENSVKNVKNKKGNVIEPLNSVAEEEKFNIKLSKPEKRKSEKGLKVSIDSKPMKKENDEIKPCDLPAKFSPSYQEVLKQCGNSLSDYKLNQKDLKLHKKRSESAFPFAGKEANQEHNVPDRSKHGIKEYAKHRANSTSTDNSTSYNNFPLRSSKILDNRPKTSSPIPNGYFQFFPNSQNDKDFMSPPIPAKKFASHFVKENDRFLHRNDSNILAHQLTDHQSKIDKYFSPPSIPIQNSRVSKIPLRNHEDCHPLAFTNSKFQLNSNPESDVLILEDRKKPPHQNVPDLSSAEITAKASPQDGTKSSFRQSPLQNVAGLRNTFENMTSNYKITSPAEQSCIPKAKQSYRLFSNQLSSMIPVKDSEGDKKQDFLESLNFEHTVDKSTSNCEIIGNEYDALYSTDERSVSCSECDCRVSQASDLEVNRESEVDILTLNASEEELLDFQQKRQERKIADKSIPVSRDKFRNKYLSGSTFAKKCVELCKDNSSDKNDRLIFDRNDSKQESRDKIESEGESVTEEILNQYRHTEEFDKKDGKSVPVASSDEYGESESADSSESEDSSISSNEAERGIDMLFERLKLDHGDDLLAAVEAMQSQRESVSSGDKVIEFPSFDWEKAPCCPFSFESLDRTFTLNPYDLMYAHKYAASQNRGDESEMADNAFVGTTGISSPFRKNGELGLPSPKFQFDFDSDTTVA